MRATNKRVLIVCEGEKTERIYFQDLVSSLGLVAVDVEISSGGGSAPISVVSYAEQRARAEGPSDDAGYDAVFCVFDRDSHETYEEAKSKVLTLRKLGVFPPVAQCAVTTIPSFEYWFILHFQYVRSPYVAEGGRTAGGVVLDALTRVDGFDGYKKNLSKDTTRMLLENTRVAVENAKRGIADARKTGEDNPSSLVFMVVEYLLSLKEN